MRGHRVIAGGWGLALGLALAATAFAGEVAGRFGGGRVLMRPWMVRYNLALGLVQLLALSLLLMGALRLPSSLAQKFSVVFLALAVSAVGATLIFPSLWGVGPWAPDALEVRSLRALIFAPSALRALGCIAVSVALFGARSSGIVALLAVDVSLVLWSWLHTPKAVMLCVHPYCAAPVGLVPWTLASLLFFWQLSRAHISPSATPT